MIAALFLLAQLAPPVAVPTQSTSAAQIAPQDWSTLPILRLRRPASSSDLSARDLSAFVRAEVAAGRCAAATSSIQGWSLTIDLAVLATPAGRVRRVTPRAIHCPTVEQYAAGLVLGSARDNVDVRGALTDTWYRTNMTFAWSQ
ncbi:hypothetical protein U1701_10735 [Sphingomonas sp. PB2P19]|uniref:hypothetical protein n=1 Tax=Sphingomonas rhamnosi TaxID=3096156 RepID=UPI002FCAD4F0